MSEGLSCLYCCVTGVKLAPLVHWDNPAKKDWYCRDHWYMVKVFQNKQKERFLNYYSEPMMQQRLSENQLRLWKSFHMSF
jgi:hypothetical protein